MPPAPQAYRPAATLLTLGDAFYDSVEPARFPETRLRFRNDRAAAQVGLNTLTDAEWIAHFARFAPLPGTLPQPLAMRYHGHQFRQYNAELGDGRGFTFAQLHDREERLLELGSKGSGQTPFSRFADGRLTLKGAVRELLASEMLEALGVPTCRTLSLIETGEKLARGDEPSPARSAVLVRLSHSHIRIGTFQRLARKRDDANMRRLVGYVLRQLYGEDSDDPAHLLDRVIDRTATLAARYMAAGFVHGVLNSDNINITGESFDYGPWRFAPTWDPDYTAAYFDHGGLYAFGRQPEAVHWNLMQLAAALRLVGDNEPLLVLLDSFPARYNAAVSDAVLWRLGVRPRDPAGDTTLANTVEHALRRTSASIDRFFFDAWGGVLPAGYGEEWQPVREALAVYIPRRHRSHPYWSAAPCSLLIDEVEAIWAAIAGRDDWAPLHAKLAAIGQLREAAA